MKEFVIDLGIAVPSDFATDVCDRLTYAHESIERIEVLTEDRRHIRVFAADGVRRETLSPVLITNARKMLEAGLEGLRVIVRDRRDAANAPRVNAFAELVERGWIAPLARGCFARSGPALRLFRHLDDRFRTLSIDGGAAEIELSSYASIDTLHKAGHFSASPQHLTFPTHLTEDLEYLQSVAAVSREEGGDLAGVMAGQLQGCGCCLTPAVCYNLYSLLSGERIDTLRMYAAANRCYRYESGRLDGLSRMWEFTMREWIFVGSSQEVTAARAKSLDAVWNLVEAWNLHAWVENANDPFFIGEFASRAAFQRNREMKYELRLSIEGDASIAATSFNLHSATFGRNFNMLLASGRPACSGCCAWGLERWVLALFSQFGFDSQNWPDELAKAVWTNEDGQA